MLRIKRIRPHAAAKNRLFVRHGLSNAPGRVHCATADRRCASDLADARENRSPSLRCQVRVLRAGCGRNRRSKPGSPAAIGTLMSRIRLSLAWKSSATPSAGTTAKRLSSTAVGRDDLQRVILVCLGSSLPSSPSFGRLLGVEGNFAAKSWGCRRATGERQRGGERRISLAIISRQFFSILSATVRNLRQCRSPGLRRRTACSP